MLNPRKELRQRRRGEGGFSLLEALIALVIIMIGLLGVAGLQALGVRSSAQAHVRTQAALSAHSLAASMRANRAYWANPDGAAPAPPASLTITASAPTTVTMSVAIPAGNCGSAACTPEQAAGYALRRWGRQLYNMQPDATATIQRIGASAANSGFSYRVIVHWSERRMQGQGVTVAPPAGTLLSTSVVVKP